MAQLRPTSRNIILNVPLIYRRMSYISKKQQQTDGEYTKAVTKFFNKVS